MTITFLELYNECAGQPWSMYDADAESLDDLESALKISINKATSFLWNLRPWIFRNKTRTIRTKTDKAAYDLPVGLLKKKAINGTQKYGVKYNGKFLPYMKDYEEADARTGEPEYFYIDDKTLYIYPTPDDAYEIELKYSSLAYALNEDEEEVYKFSEEADTLNIPEKYEEFEQQFVNCLISKAMMYAIDDLNDENYAGYEAQYEDALGVLEKYCTDVNFERSIGW